MSIVHKGIKIASNAVTGPQGEPGEGVPAGGAAGQVLSKKTQTNYDTEWVDPPNTGLTVEQVNTLIAAAIVADNQAKYYVGKVIIDTANVNPATYLGFGTWAYWVLVKYLLVLILMMMTLIQLKRLVEVKHIL